MAEQSTTLKLTDISKSFSRVDSDTVTRAVSHISLEMQEGKFISLVGPSGCGKSTILQMIAGLLMPTTGEITVNDKPVKGPSSEIGMVFQNPTLFPWLTVKDNIAFSFKIKGNAKENEDKVEKMLKVIGLEKFKDDYPAQLSGGMAQRVALARAMISQPKILLMDEPLGALDAFTRMNMQNEILDMWKVNKQLVVMVTHDIDEAVYMSSDVVIMDANPGRVKEIVPIDLPYPRNRSSAKFVEYRNQILDVLHFGEIEEK